MPDPILLAIAGALAGKAATALASGGRTALGRLYRLVAGKLSAKEQDTKLLEAVAERTDVARPEQEPEVGRLAEVLDRAGRDDPEFAGRLRELWTEARTELTADRGGVINEVSGDVSGTVVQARDIHGGINIGGQPRPGM
jgi:predicted phage gp36 major capsid-like protein